MTQAPVTALKIFGASLFAILLALTIWSVFFDKHGNDPLTPDEQKRMDDLLNHQRSGVTVVGVDASADHD